MEKLRLTTIFGGLAIGPHNFLLVHQGFSLN